MHDPRFRNDAHLPAGPARAQAKLDVLTVEAESLVERPDRCPDFAPKGDGRAADPVDLAPHIDAGAPTNEAGQVSCAADDADHPEQGWRPAAAPLRSSVG